ncbi:MAG: hypothetical protein E7072_03210 [Bacteroidales bacterium]|nr:hypothetical protein [Bacteroidales bacterium]
MDAKVQEFINKMKEEEKKQRDDKLISLGLTDENKKTVIREYLNYKRYDAKYDETKKQHYIEKEVESPIEVTEDEYQEILKYSSFIKNETTETTEIKDISTTWASTIKVIANILLVLNIIGGFILWIVLGDKDFAWIPIVSALSYCILFYPLIVGFSKIVAVAERKLQE